MTNFLYLITSLRQRLLQSISRSKTKEATQRQGSCVRNQWRWFRHFGLSLVESIILSLFCILVSVGSESQLIRVCSCVPKLSFHAKNLELTLEKCIGHSRDSKS